MSVICVVQARLGSSRLPGKVLADVMGKPMLALMLDRLSTLDVDRLVVATSVLPRDDAVADVAAASGASVARGSEEDVLGRFVTALDSYPAQTVVRLTADCPLMDPAIVATTLALRADAGADYASNTVVRTFPDGLDVEVMTAGALRAAAAEAVEPREREHVTPFLYRRPERFKLVALRNGEDLSEERWTVDTADDLRLVRRVVAHFAPDTRFGWRDVLAFLGRRRAPPAPRSVTLRPAAMSDARCLLALRNDAESARFSRSGSTVGAEEHQSWLSDCLAGLRSRIWIAEVDGRPIGQVRLDVTEGVGLVSLAVDGGQRGKGYGAEILRHLQDHVRRALYVRVLHAEVNPGNVASLRTFERVGFRYGGTHAGFLQLRWAP